MPCTVRVELPAESPHGESYEMMSHHSFRDFVKECNNMQMIPAGFRDGHFKMIPAEEIVRLHKLSDN